MGALNKLVQPIKGEPMVRKVVQQVLASRCDRVLVVVGHQAGDVRQALAGLPVEFIDNPHYREGLAASVRAAAHAARPNEALMICLGDMPQVPSAVIDQLIGAYRDHCRESPGSAGRPRHVAPGPAQTLAAAFQPELGGRRGNPVLWTPGTVGLLKRLDGDEGARSVLKRLGDAVVAVPVQSGGIFMDVDTPEALRDARRQNTPEAQRGAHGQNESP